LAHSDSLAKKQPERAANRGFRAWAGVLSILSAALFGYLSLVQLGFIGHYDVPDVGSAGADALGAAVGLAVGGWLIRGASSAALALSAAYSGIVVVAGVYQFIGGSNDLAEPPWVPWRLE